MSQVQAVVTKICDLNIKSVSWNLSGKAMNVSDPIPYKKDVNKKFFEFKLYDSANDFIRVVIFHNYLNKFQSIIKENRYYTLTGGQIKVSAYNNSLEIIADVRMKITELLDPEVPIELPKPDFIEIINIPNATTNINVVAACLFCSDTLFTKNNKPYQLITLADSTAKIDAKVWNKQYFDNFSSGDIIIITEATKNSYAGSYEINITATSKIQLSADENNQDDERLKQLTEWYVQQYTETLDLVNLSFRELSTQTLLSADTTQSGNSQTSTFIFSPIKSPSSSSQPTSIPIKYEISTNEMLRQAKHELKEVEKDESEIQIKKARLHAEIAKLEAQLHLH